MRLLKRDSDGQFCLTEDLVGVGIPSYAILSHTWGPISEEVTFQDLVDRTGHHKAGYEKIRFCADQVQRHGLLYFWIDTCCIDKTNNTELAEAINSMFRWYRGAARCYVYLSDVSVTSCEQSDWPPPWDLAFRASRWFTRGWTLQELLAPASVEFFARDGTPLGNKLSLQQQIHEITEIAIAALRGDPLPRFGVEERFKWAEGRETTREEDWAYSLLGIFGVFISPIYGEGKAHAVRRLRQKINDALPSLPSLPTAKGAAFDTHAEGDHNRTCHPDTRVDLLRQIDEWVDDPTAKSIFWLNGMAGTGKSTISRTVARRCDARGMLGASFFFKRGEGDCGHAGLFFTTIAAQLVVKQPAIAAHIKIAIDSDPAITDKMMTDQFEKLVLNPLSRTSQAALKTPSTLPANLVIVVDALDECSRDENVRLIINLFSHTNDLQSPRLRVFVTSRPELPIRLGFMDIKGKYLDLVLHEIPEPVVEHDIQAYLASELARIKADYDGSVCEDRRLPADWPGQSTTQTLVRMAIPLFIFAATVCRFLADRRCGNPDTKLQEVMKYQTSGQESQLNTTYLPVLNQLVSGLTDRKRKKLLEDFRYIIGAIVILASPLSTSSLAQILLISKGTVDAMLDLLHSVLSIPARSDVPVRLLHLSFRNFLVDYEREDDEFWVDETQTHRMLSAKCLRILEKRLKADICRLRWPGTARSAVDQQRINEVLPPEVQYACLYWVHHIEQENKTEQAKNSQQTKYHRNDLSQAYKFLHVHLLHWLEALSLMGRASESIGLIRTLQGLLEPGPSTAISAFLHDIVRFIQANIATINLAPLQAYSSALAFTPENSIVKETFRGEIPGWLSLPPKANVDWSACLQTLEGHSTAVTSVAFSRDSTHIVSGSWDRTVRVWQANTGECIQTLKGHCNEVSSVAFSPDGTHIVSGSFDKTVRVWQANTGDCIQTLKGHDNEVSSVAFSPNDTQIVSGSHDNTVRVWQANTGDCIHTLKGHGNEVSSVAFSPDGTHIVSGSWDYTVRVWQAITGKCVQTIKGHGDIVGSVAFSPDSTHVVSGSWDRTVRIWQANTGECIQTLEGHSSTVTSVAFSLDGTHIVSGSVNDTVRVWQANTGECVQTLKGHSGLVTSAAFSPDGTHVVSGSWDRTVRVWQANTSECVQTLKGHNDEITSVAFSPNGTHIVSGSHDNTIRVWQANTGECVQTLKGHGDIVTSVAFSPGSTHIVSGSNDRTVRVWQANTDECIQTLKGHGDEFTSVAFSPDGTHIVSGSNDSTVQVWQANTGQCVQTLKGHSRPVNSVAFSSDGTHIVSGSWDSTVRVWQANTGECVQTLNGHSSFVTSVAFSPDGSHIVSGSWDNTVRVWQTKTGGCLQVVDIGMVTQHLAFKRDAPRILTDVGAVTVDPSIAVDASSDAASDLYGSASTTYHPNDSNYGHDKEDSSGPSSGSGYSSGQNRVGYGLSTDRFWVTWHGTNLFWLPAEFRPVCSAVAASAVVIGCRSGRVVVMGFSSDKLPRLVLGGDGGGSGDEMIDERVGYLDVVRR